MLAGSVIQLIQSKGWDLNLKKTFKVWSFLLRVRMKKC